MTLCLSNRFGICSVPNFRDSSHPSGVTMNRLTAADIRFGNDAFMFGLGASTRFPSERLLCLTLGTGLGSAFVENGQIVAGRHGIPSSGMLFAEPYRDHIVDSYFGKRGILNMASGRDSWLTGST